ncbi:MAG: CHAT domain-containing protein [Saprospiraceae bacterium]
MAAKPTVRAIWDGTLLSGESANEDTFQTIAGQYGLILLSTHSQMHHRRPEYSFAAFSQPAGGFHRAAGADNLLFVSEIYNLRLRAELVSSVPAKALPKVVPRRRHREPYSRLRDGRCAYGSCLLLNVDDQQPQPVWRLFPNLRSGASTFEALAQARRSYLAEAGGLKAHPFYWAGFVAFGSGNPVAALAGAAGVHFFGVLPDWRFCFLLVGGWFGGMSVQVSEHTTGHFLCRTADISLHRFHAEFSVKSVN